MPGHLLQDPSTEHLVEFMRALQGEETGAPMVQFKKKVRRVGQLKRTFLTKRAKACVEGRKLVQYIEEYYSISTSMATDTAQYLLEEDVVQCVSFSSHVSLQAASQQFQATKALYIVTEPWSLDHIPPTPTCRTNWMSEVDVASVLARLGDRAYLKKNKVPFTETGDHLIHVSGKDILAWVPDFIQRTRGECYLLLQELIDQDSIRALDLCPTYQQRNLYHCKKMFYSDGDMMSAFPSYFHSRKLSQEVTEGLEQSSEGLTMLLCDYSGRSAFRAYLMTKRCHENVDFWFDTQVFRYLASKYATVDYNGLRNMAQRVVEVFLLPDSPAAVNVDHRITKNIQKSLSEGVEPEMFDSAQSVVFRLMVFDAFPKFQATDEYSQYQVRRFRRARSDSRKSSLPQLLRRWGSSGSHHAVEEKGE